MLPPFILFTYYFVGKIKGIKLKAIFWYFGGALISYLALTTPLFVKSIHLKYPHISGIAGSLDPFGRLYIFSSLLIGLINLLKEYFKSIGFKKLQIKYFITGTFIYALTGIIFTAIIPLFTRESAYCGYTAFFSLIWVGLSAYAITHYHLFEIRVILTEILVGVMGIILAILPFVMPATSLRILMVTIFILFCIFAYYLIKATHQETKRREEAEKMAAQEKALRLQAEKLTAARDQFLLSAQHYFRTPLTSIVGLLEMMSQGLYGKEKLSQTLKSALELRNRRRHRYFPIPGR